ncbi:uncharacterized protein [Mytilus edulis]|uniref:uncharacterized protein n=1 Tax=Mytilus edulis TaxID=6550 RepID=UPI0039EF1256
MDYGMVWRPGECLPESTRTASLKVVGDIMPPQRTNTPISTYGSSPDPDYENGENILGRLQDNGSVTPTPLVNINCECLIKHTLTKKQQDLYSSNHFTDSDSDDEDTNVLMLIKMLNVLPSRLPSKTACKALNTVMDSYVCKEPVTKEQVMEIWNFLKHSNTAMREMSLKFFTKLSAVPTNADILLDLGILDFVITVLTVPQSPVFSLAIQLIQAIVSQDGLKNKWIEPVSCKFLPLLLTNLSNDSVTLEFKYSICCVFRELVKYAEFIEITQTQIIPAVSSIKDCSGKLREVFTEILTGMLLHTDILPPDVIDSGIVPSTVSMIRDGPCGTQVQALKLLSGLTDTESGIPSVIDNTHAVPYIVCCIKESKCRKVKREALQTLCHLTKSRRLGLCKEFMVQTASYLNPTDQNSYTQLMGRSSSLGNRVNTPTRGRHVEKDSVLWKGLHRLIKIVGHLIIKESLAETDKSGKVTTVGYKPCIDMCPVRVVSLTRCVLFLQNVCLWPSGKNKQDVSNLDLKNFTDSDKQRLKLSKLNRSLAQRVWDTAGTTIVRLLGTFSDKLINVLHIAKQCKDNKGTVCIEHSDNQEAISKMVDKKGLVDLSCIVDSEELDLIKSLLELLLCISLCSCKDFPDLTPKKNKSPHHMTSQGRSTRSDSSLGRPPLPKKLTRPSSAHHHRSLSPVKDVTRQSWVKDNPYLTNTIDRASIPPESCPNKSDVGHFHTELLKKEAATERRLIRKCLYESDTIRIVGAFLQCSQNDLQALSCQILRCCIQPLEEKVYQQMSSSPSPSPPKLRTRPQSAVGANEAEHKMKVAFHYMSPEIANLIKGALGPDFAEVAMVKEEEEVKVEETHITDIEAVDRLNLYMKSKEPIKIESKPSSSPKPVINMGRPIANQCRECLLKEGGASLIIGIFSKSKDVRKCHVLLLQDLVHFGDVENHMTLSQYGCMQRLLDFIRMNKDDELLEIIGLIIIQMLVSSDERIKQVFNRYGGTRLLTTMTRLTTGLLREEVAKTLHTVSHSKGQTKKPIRPSSAPLIRTTAHSVPDVWDDIQERWQVEDKVCALLKSWKK